MKSSQTEHGGAAASPGSYTQHGGPDGPAVIPLNPDPMALRRQRVRVTAIGTALEVGVGDGHAILTESEARALILELLEAHDQQLANVAELVRDVTGQPVEVEPLATVTPLAVRR